MCAWFVPHSRFSEFHLHAGRRPDLDEIFAHGDDLAEVAAHLVVHEREPVGDPEAERGVRAVEGAFVHVDGFEESLCDKYPAFYRSWGQAGSMGIPRKRMEGDATNTWRCHSILACSTVTSVLISW